MNFRDRIEASNEVSAMAWPDHVYTASARAARPCSEAGCNRRPRRRFALRLLSPSGRASVIMSCRCSSKAIFPATWPSRIENSMPSSVCSVVPLTTFFPALEANTRRAASLLAVTAASVPLQNLFSARWRFFHGIPRRAAA